jgi:hypothetical protein
MGGFTQYSVAQRAVRSPVNVCVQEEMTLPFGLYGELNALMVLLRWVRKSSSWVLVAG